MTWLNTMSIWCHLRYTQLWRAFQQKQARWLEDMFCIFVAVALGIWQMQCALTSLACHAKCSPQWTLSSLASHLHGNPP